jgi:ATP-dependent DNA ligase
MKPQTPPLTKLNFIEPMYARLVNELPEGEEWLYEVKFDGYRCLAGRDSTGIRSVSPMPWKRDVPSLQRSEQSMTPAFGELFEVDCF